MKKCLQCGNAVRKEVNRFCSRKCSRRYVVASRCAPTAGEILSQTSRANEVTGCIEWTGARRAPGSYGRLRRNGKFLYAHRAAYELAHGPIPADMCVCHRRDNPICINPAHLFLGTHADNVADKVAKGRQARGAAVLGSRQPKGDLPRERSGGSYDH